MPNEEKKEFTFIREQIKNKPFYKKKWFTKGLTGIGLAVIFGGTAGLTFGVVMPWAEKQFGEPDTPQNIVIARDETETEGGLLAEEQQSGEPSEDSTESTEVQTETEKQQPEKIIEKKELELSDYKRLYDELYEVADGVSASIVTVTGVSGDLDWSIQVDESQIQVSGLVFAQNDQNYFILTESRGVEQAEKIQVSFSDGTTTSAYLQKKDDVTGCAVIRVPVTGLTKSARESIRTADLGSSVSVRQGTPVISIGSPLGYNSSLSFGMITTVTKTSGVDSQYTLMCTDIIGGIQGSGVLIDLNGRIIGIISQDFQQRKGIATVAALGISDMKDLMEAMCNSKDFPYLGITGYEISEAVSRQNQVPMGIYIKEVETDSPAMHEGIQRGIDILTEIQGKEIKTMEEYMTELRRYQPGQVVKLKLKRRGIEGYVDLEVSVVLESR